MEQGLQLTAFVRIFTPGFPAWFFPTCSVFTCPSPDEVATEDKAQDEDKYACPKDDHVDVQRQILEGDGWHGARLVGVNQSQTTEAP